MLVFATRTSVSENDIVALKPDEVHPPEDVSFSKVQEMAVEADVTLGLGEGGLSVRMCSSCFICVLCKYLGKENGN